MELAKWKQMQRICNLLLKINWGPRAGREEHLSNNRLSLNCWLPKVSIVSLQDTPSEYGVTKWFSNLHKTIKSLQNMYWQFKPYKYWIKMYASNAPLKPVPYLKRFACAGKQPTYLQKIYYQWNSMPSQSGRVKFKPNKSYLIEHILAFNTSLLIYWQEQHACRILTSRRKM